MSHIIPTPLFEKTDETKRLFIKSLSLDERNVNGSVKDDFYDFIRKLELPVGNDVVVSFTHDFSLENEEYRLEVNEKITVYSSGEAGKVFALQTLKQLLFEYGRTIPFIEIKDKPKYKIRGFMLDVGRYFYPVDEVKLFIRKMSLHKLNFLHLHLTEDQGWRVEIYKYPLLTEIASVRKQRYGRNMFQI